MNRPQHLNKLATAAMIPLVAVGFFIAMRSMESQSARPFVPEGVLVVANLRAESLTFYDFIAGESVDVALAGPPHEMVQVGSHLFVTLGRADLVAEVDLAGRTVERYLVLDGSPHGIATDGERLYVGLDDEATVVVLDATTLAESERIDTGNAPHQVDLLGQSLLVANAGDGTLEAIGRGSVVTRASGEAPEALAIVGSSAIAVANAGDGTIALFDLPGMERAAVYAIGGRPVRLLAMGDRLAVARARFGDVAILDPVSGELDAAVDVGRLTDGMCLAPSGDWLAASANGDNELHIIDTRAWHTSMQYETPDGPGACTWIAGD